MGERLPDPGGLPAPTGKQVQVWWARVPVGRMDDALREALATDLDSATLARLDRFHQVKDRDRGLAAHSLLRRLLAAVAGATPSELVLNTRCAGCGETDHGKPYLDVGTPVPPVEVNLSHSWEVVCVALTAPGIQVGVDVEYRRSVDWGALRRSVFADLEWAVTEETDDPARHRMDAWARKEASVKASGHGMTLPFRDVPIENAGWGGWTTKLPAGAGSAAGWDLDLDPEVAAAVAIQHPEQPDPPDLPAIRQVDLADR
ncbi:MAG TPA: 4'-phosphopantetheinyl transferase superfamily protein [Kineosporiaceae bacterium]|nr:4'-phosphopantetheinyl transferase superfamily protein [Kineosporiaceae bacterium]